MSIADDMRRCGYNGWAQDVERMEAELARLQGAAAPARAGCLVPTLDGRLLVNAVGSTEAECHANLSLLDLADAELKRVVIIPGVVDCQGLVEGSKPAEGSAQQAATAAREMADFFGRAGLATKDLPRLHILLSRASDAGRRAIEEIEDGGGE